MLPQCSHITRKRGVYYYYYRRRLPQPSTRELTLSLRTRCFRKAEWLAAKLDEEFRIIMSVVKKDGQPADIQRIAREYLRGALEHDLSVRKAQAGQALNGFAEWSASFEYADEELDKVKGELVGRGHPERHADLVDWLMDQHGVPADQQHELFFAILRAHVAQWEIIRRRTLGDLEVPGTPVTDSATAHYVAETPTPRKDGRLFSAVLPGFIELMQENEGWRGQTNGDRLQKSER
jgi:hypothetical protein